MVECDDIWGAARGTSWRGGVAHHRSSPRGQLHQRRRRSRPNAVPYSRAS